MFTQIQTELDLLLITLDKKIDYVTTLRINESNPNLFSEYSGRLIGLTEAISEIKRTKQIINSQITEILENTTDGNFIAKLTVLEDENQVLSDKVYLLKQDIKKYKKMNLDKSNKELKELSQEDIDERLEIHSCKDDIFDEEDEDD